MAPNPNETARIHERIDGLRSDVSALGQSMTEAIGLLTVQVERSITTCGVCRPIVLGNGNEGIASRVARLEEAKTSMAWFVTKIIATCGVAATLLSIGISVAVAYLTKG